MIARLGAVAGLLLLGACSSVVSGTSQEISVNTVPSGADCALVRNGETIARVKPTPGSAVVQKTKHDIIIKCTKDGYIAADYVNKSGVEGAVLGNIILGGGIGWAIDSASGADNKYTTNVDITLARIEAAPAAAAAAAAPAATPVAAAVHNASARLEIPCDGVPITMKLQDPQCFKTAGVDQQVVARLGPGDRTAIFGTQYAAWVHIAAPGSAVSSQASDRFLRTMADFNDTTRVGRNWSPAYSTGNAWVVTFVSNRLRCLGFSNFGPPRDNGYAWAVEGVWCDPQPGNAERALGATEISTVLNMVLPTGAQPRTVTAAAPPAPAPAIPAPPAPTPAPVPAQQVPAAVAPVATAPVAAPPANRRDDIAEGRLALTDFNGRVTYATKGDWLIAYTKSPGAMVWDVSYQGVTFNCRPGKITSAGQVQTGCTGYIAGNVEVELDLHGSLTLLRGTTSVRGIYAQQIPFPDLRPRDIRDATAPGGA